MPAKSRRPMSPAQAALTAVFIVLCLVNLDNSVTSILHSEQWHAHPPELLTIAPQNLAGVARSFELGVRARDLTFPTDRMTRYPEWQELQDRLSAYTRRLQQLDAQEQELNSRQATRLLVTSLLSFVVAVAMSVVSLRARSQPVEG